MRVIHAANVADAWAQACVVWRDVWPVIEPTGSSQSRQVRAYPTPMATVYARPCERVLLDPRRDANPLFHLAEAMWMLAGRDDAAWLDQFVGNFSSRFAEPDGRQHGAYGRRWREWFDLHEDVSESGYLGTDQLEVVVDMLRRNPSDRQAVIAMWDPVADLGVPGLKDRPCNTHAYLRLRATGEYLADRVPVWALDMTVCCRSNDVVWGCYGANAVHFGFLQEYLAARIGAPPGHAPGEVIVGTLTQISNNWHVYEDSLSKMSVESSRETARRPYPGTQRLVDDAETFDFELRYLVGSMAPGSTVPLVDAAGFRNRFLSGTLLPVAIANARRREGSIAGALEAARGIAAPDWRAACLEWLGRREKKSTPAETMR